MAFLTYLNYFAMIIGYITIVIILLLIVLLTSLYLKEKYNDWKWRKEQGKRQKEQEENKEKQKEIPKEAIPEGINIEVSVK